MRICPRCETNYILNDTDELCKVCNENAKPTNATKLDDNKLTMENYLLPLLQRAKPEALEGLTTKKISYELFKLRIPLLIKCKDQGKDCCKKEVSLGNSSVYRYYIDAYTIHGVKYHICSQWWSFGTENSKEYLKILEELKDKLL